MPVTLPNPVHSEVAPLEAKSIEVPKRVDPNAYYKVHVQIGTNASWMNFRGVRNWQRRPGQEPGSQPLYDPKYVVVSAIRPGDEVNGLISETARWVAANRKDSKPDGTINRMFAVIAIEEAPGFEPERFTEIGSGGLSMEMLKLLIQSEAQKLFDKMMGTESAKK